MYIRRARERSRETSARIERAARTRRSHVLYVRIDMRCVRDGFFLIDPSADYRRVFPRDVHVLLRSRRV